MKAGGIVLVIVAALLISAGAFFGFFSMKNAGSADRLERRLGSRGGAWVGALVRRKAAKQRNLALGLGIPGLLLVGGGIVMIKKGKKGNTPAPV